MNAPQSSTLPQLCCPKCGRTRILTGSENGPYNPATGEMLALFRTDTCLDCKSQWTVMLSSPKLN